MNSPGWPGGAAAGVIGGTSAATGAEKLTPTVASPALAVLVVMLAGQLIVGG